MSQGAPEPEAAVAIVHAREGEESVLLIRRTEREDDPWSGHWSFPGGRREPADRDLVETALRELAEECGIHLHRDRLEASLPPTNAGRRVGRVVSVAPFLFRADNRMPTVLDPHEAAESLWVPLSVLRDPERHCLTPVPRLPLQMAFPAIQLNGVPLWGFTYRVLTEWLGLHSKQEQRDRVGFEAARLVLEFLLAQGLTLGHAWIERNGNGRPLLVAQVRGTIPVAAVLDQFSFPKGQVPPLSALEIGPDAVRIFGLAQEEYLIEAEPQGS